MKKIILIVSLLTVMFAETVSLKKYFNENSFNLLKDTIISVELKETYVKKADLKTIFIDIKVDLDKDIPVRKELLNNTLYQEFVLKLKQEEMNIICSNKELKSFKGLFNFNIIDNKSEKSIISFQLSNYFGFNSLTCN